MIFDLSYLLGRKNNSAECKTRCDIQPTEPAKPPIDNAFWVWAWLFLVSFLILSITAFDTLSGESGGSRDYAPAYAEKPDAPSPPKTYEGPAIVIHPGCEVVGHKRLSILPGVQQDGRKTLVATYDCVYGPESIQDYEVRTSIPSDATLLFPVPVIWVHPYPEIEYSTITWWDPDI